MPGHHAGDVAGLICIGEQVLVVVQTGGGGHVAGAGDEGNVGIILGGIQHVALVAIGVREDDIAALFRQIHGGVIAVFILRDVVAENNLRIGINT